MNLKNTILIFLIGFFLTGCSTYKKTGAWSTDSVNYTISRDRQTGDLADYFGVSWSLK